MQANKTVVSKIGDELTRSERMDLAILEATIQKGLKSFHAVGEALEKIHSQRLYRQSHSAFEDYCQEKWGFNERRARQLIEAWKVGTIVPIQNEAQARALSGRDPETQKEAFAQATAGGRTPTAKALSEILDQIDEAEMAVGPAPEPRPQTSLNPASVDARCVNYGRLLGKLAGQVDPSATSLTEIQREWLAVNPFAEPE